MVFNIHAGHNPDGKIACGAVGLIRESTEARKVKDKVIAMLQSQGHTVYDCTVDNGTSQNDVLRKIADKCNAHTASYDISIHFNAGSSKSSDGKTTGTEAYIYPSASQARDAAQRIVDSIAALGFRNRGVKTSNSLYFLRHAKNPAVLIECCFVDDPDDVALYHADSMAQAIARGLTGAAASVAGASKPSSAASSSSASSSGSSASAASFLHNGVDYSLVFQPAYYCSKYADLKKAFGTNAKLLFEHFTQYGMKEGRQAIGSFNVDTYRSRYADLQRAFGDNLSSYYKHYIQYGYQEGRKAT